MTLSNKTGGKAPGPRPVIVRDSDTRFGERGRSASGGGAATRMRGIGVTIPPVRGPGMATIRDARSSQTPVQVRRATSSYRSSPSPAASCRADQVHDPGDRARWVQDHVGRQLDGTTRLAAEREGR